MRKEKDTYTHKTLPEDFPREKEGLQKVLVKVIVLIKLSEITTKGGKRHRNHD